MALPNMQPIYKLRKNIYEQSIVGRRNQESDFHQKWMQNAAFFHEGGVNAAKKKTWESDISFNNSLQKYKSSHKIETSALTMELRKSKLRNLLQYENKYFEDELANLNVAMPSSRKEELLDRVLHLRTSREEKRKEVVKSCLYKQWKENNPKLKEVQSNLHTKHVIEEWGRQLEQQKQREVECKAVESKEFEERELQHRLELDHDENQRQQAIQNADDIAKQQRAQIKELKMREQQCIEDKENEKKLIKSQWKVAEIIRDREIAESSRKKLELGKILLRQHGAALRRRSALIQEELSEDLKYLELLSAQEKEDAKLSITRRKAAQADVNWMKTVVAEQLDIEKERQIELESLYQDEAARMWERREEEWQKERHARTILMSQVCEQRQQQVDDNLSELRQRQKDMLIYRESLLADLEQLKLDTSREHRNANQATTERRQELETQIEANMKQKENQKLKINLDLLNDNEVNNAEDDFVELETMRMKNQGFQEQFQFRRKKNAWT